MIRPISLSVLLVVASAGGLAVAQAPISDEAALKLARRQAQDAALRSNQLERAAAEAVSEAERLRARSEALVAGIEESEAGISAAEARVRLLRARRAEQQARLARRQQPLIGLTSVLQTMARRPPALALVQPGSVEEATRVRALLASTIPVIRQRTAGLRAEIAQSEFLRTEAERAAQALAGNRRELAGRRRALAQLEESQRQRSYALARSALSESDRAIALDEEARDISGRMSSRAFQAGIVNGLAALPTPLPRPGSARQPSARVRYRMPVTGRIVTGFGEISSAGIHSRGLILQVASNAQVVAPRSGRIAYAGRFRSYGEVVIIDHGGGWTTTITNLAALRVRRGAPIEEGDPIGRAGDSPDIGLELRHNGRPQPIAQFIAPG